MGYQRNIAILLSKNFTREDVVTALNEVQKQVDHGAAVHISTDKDSFSRHDVSSLLHGLFYVKSMLYALLNDKIVIDGMPHLTETLKNAYLRYKAVNETF